MGRFAPPRRGHDISDQMTPATAVGHHLDLPGRGTTFIREIPGPPGAPTLFLLHGWTVTADLTWTTAMTALGRHFHVVAPDHRGHGQGIHHDGPFRLTDCADDVAATARVLGVDRIIVVGYSMGGAVAQLTWHRHPDLVAGLVLCASGHRFTSQNRGLFTALAAASVLARPFTPATRNHLANAVIRRITGQSPQRDWALAMQEAHDWMKVIEAGRELSRFDSARWLGRMDIPVAQVITTADDVVQTADQRACATLAGASSVQEIEADHAACTNRPDLFVPALFSAAHAVARQLDPDLAPDAGDLVPDPELIGFRRARPAPPPSLMDL